MRASFQYDPNNPARESVLTYLCETIRAAGQVVRIALTDPKRTLLQNDRMWAMLGDIAKQVQWCVDGQMQYLSDEEWKDIFTAALTQEQRVAQGINGGFVLLGRRTSKMSVKTMCDLQELMAAFGAERQVKWTPPKEKKAA